MMCTGSLKYGVSDGTNIFGDCLLIGRNVSSAPFVMS